MFQGKLDADAVPYMRRLSQVGWVVRGLSPAVFLLGDVRWREE
jgi:hypothetical protein